MQDQINAKYEAACTEAQTLLAPGWTAEYQDEYTVLNVRHDDATDTWWQVWDQADNICGLPGTGWIAVLMLEGDPDREYTATTMQEVLKLAGLS